MVDRLCFQSEQTAGRKSYAKIGVCGKSAEVATQQDELTCALHELVRAAAKGEAGKHTYELMIQGLFNSVANISFDRARVTELIGRIEAEKIKLDSSAKGMSSTKPWKRNEDIVSLHSTLFFGLRGLAAYAWRAHTLGKDDHEVMARLHKGVRAIGKAHSADEWLKLFLTISMVNLKCMGLLGEANNSSCRQAVPATLTAVREGPCQRVHTGHNIMDLNQVSLIRPRARKKM